MVTCMKRLIPLAAVALLTGCEYTGRKDVLTSSYSSAVPGPGAAAEKAAFDTAIESMRSKYGTPPPTALATPAIPRFSTAYMDRSVKPGDDFYAFATGTWRKNNPVPSDKARWSGFDELDQRNWFLIRQILEEASAGKLSGGSGKQVGDLYASAMDTNRLDALRFSPLKPEFNRIAALKSSADLPALLGELHVQSVGGMFSTGVEPDAKNSSVYALGLGQGGLGLPDRDYYLAEGFAKQRDAYHAHVTKMLTLAGDSPDAAKAAADTVLDVETALAKISKPRVELRDPLSNYNKLTRAELVALAPAFDWNRYFTAIHAPSVPDVIVGQTNFFSGLNTLVKERPLSDWQTYLRWHVIRDAAPWLHAEAAQESFAFYGTTLRGQPAQEPRWQRSAKLVDAGIGEALGAIYVERHFPPAAKARMAELIANLRVVFVDRLAKLEWMSETTRTKAKVKFDRFTQKIGHPDKFRDYSSVVVRRDDLIGNLRRAAQFEHDRLIKEIGKPVDLAEWHMTPQTVNAYFNPLQNEIVFPAGILQPPFFDVDMDDAVNYGAIGVVIGHEITHGYDDQGRKFDADGNLNDWWTEADAKEFDARAQKLIDQYGAYEPLPGKKVNGQLTLGENIADLGGTSIAYEALQRALAKDPSKRKTIDGFTPEQRFFLSLAQLWRANYREAELLRRLTVDPHSPAMYRGYGPHVNMPQFYDAFGITEGMPMWRPVKDRAFIW